MQSIDWDKFIRQAVHERVEKIIDEEAAEAAKRIRARTAQLVGDIATRIVERVDVSNPYEKQTEIIVRLTRR